MPQKPSYFFLWQHGFFSGAQRWLPLGVFVLVFFLSCLLLVGLWYWGGEIWPGLSRWSQPMALQGLSPEKMRQEMEALRKDIQGLMLLIGFTVAMSASVLFHWVRVARRESETRAAADALRGEAQAAQQEAVAASQDKAKFLGMLSHELLTPLQTILSTLGLIEDRGGVEISDPTFVRLKESVRILRSRMSDLVDFAKLSVGQLELRIRAFTPLRLLTMLVDDYSEALLEKNLDFHWEPSEELSQRVYSDPTRIRQILENLLSNAIKYTDRGGLTLEAKVCHSQTLRVEISDSGTGISEDQLPHIFDPFYRVKDSAHMAVGSGLGLAVVKSLMDMLKGRIDVHSELGKGSRFIVEIPVSLRPVERLAPGHLHRSREPVLVVDDDAAIRNSMADVVRALGYEVVEVSNGRSALQEAYGRKFSTIFCDIQLPDVSGIDVAEQLRQGDGPNTLTYMVRMSAFHEPDDRAAFVFNARIDKPLDWRQISEVLTLAEEL